MAEGVVLRTFKNYQALRQILPAMMVIGKIDILMMLWRNVEKKTDPNTQDIEEHL